MMIRKTVAVLMIGITVAFALTGCGGSDGAAEKKVDVDLTAMSGTMVYSEVSHLMNTPEEYMGKTVKMKGEAASYKDESTGKEYYACIIKDATACCTQGLEYELASGDGYPEDGSEITVVGVVNKYEEDGLPYTVLEKAEMVK